MRELEFLPAWYPQLRQRKRLVVLQVYMSLVLLAGLGLWMLKFDRNVAADRRRLAELNDQLQDTQLVLHKLDELEKLDKQLKVQEEVVEKIGLHVEVTRIINALEQAMSNDMSLLNLSIEVFEQQRSATQSLAALAGAGAKPAFDRSLKIKVQGVAPTDVELANFLYKLGNNPLFERVAMNYAKELTQNGHVMREFEVSFSVNLNSHG
jgi:Tfp pilus assembly protein PilN